MFINHREITENGKQVPTGAINVLGRDSVIPTEEGTEPGIDLLIGALSTGDLGKTPTNQLTLLLNDPVQEMLKVKIPIAAVKTVENNDVQNQEFGRDQ